MTELQPDILHCIGNTSLVALRKIVPGNGARILLKLDYHQMADELWSQAGGHAERAIDGLVQSVGTAASLRGLAERLRHHHPGLQVVAVEPAESPVLSGGRTGAHKIDGIGAGFVVPLWHGGIADRNERVSTDEATAMTTRLAREEGIFAGTSTDHPVRHRHEVPQQVMHGGRRVPQRAPPPGPPPPSRCGGLLLPRIHSPPNVAPGPDRLLWRGAPRWYNR